MRKMGPHGKLGPAMGSYYIQDEYKEEVAESGKPALYGIFSTHSGYKGLITLHMEDPARFIWEPTIAYPGVLFAWEPERRS